MRCGNSIANFYVTDWHLVKMNCCAADKKNETKGSVKNYFVELCWQCDIDLVNPIERNRRGSCVTLRIL